jgi:hypothetical protein
MIKFYLESKYGLVVCQETPYHLEIIRLDYALYISTVFPWLVFFTMGKNLQGFL